MARINSSKSEQPGNNHTSLDLPGLLLAVEELARRDVVLAGVVQKYGPPPLWRRPQSLATLTRVILEQQVSLTSAQAIYNRVVNKLGTPKPDTLLQLGEGGLRRLGITRQKSRYIVGVARAVSTGELRLLSLRYRSDTQVRTELTRLVGIGEWTANIYLLMALRRPDIWPEGDLALLVAIQKLYGYDARPTPDQGVEHAHAWAPFRSVAARVLWHWYLGQ